MTRAALALGAAAGLGLDALLGEPPDAFHPVARFGGAMVALEPLVWRDERAAGALYAAVGVGASALVGVALDRGARGFGAGHAVGGAGVRRSRAGACVAVAIATGVCVAGRMLGATANGIAGPLADGDVAEARVRLPSLVGRTAAALEASAIARATIESVAENAVDAVVAPVLWAVVGGAPGVLAYRAANTLDAMVGHHSERYERFGWASALLDDVLNWVPARVTAALVALVRPASACEVWGVVRRDAPAHPSPNSGVAEAAFAAALGVRLGGVNTYGDRVEDRGTLGDGRAPEPADIRAAVRLLRDVRMAAALLLVAGAGLGAALGVARGAANFALRGVASDRRAA